MSDLIDQYKRSGLVSSKQGFEHLTCGDCQHFTGEECDGFQNEGSEKYDDSTACSDFLDIDEDDD